VEPARGFLTGTVTNLGDADFRNNAPRFQAEILAVNNDRHAAVRRLAASLAITPGQRALAWLLHQHRAVVSIPGSRTAAHIDENIEWPASISIPTRSTRSTACSPTPSPPAPRCCDGRYGGHRQPDRGRRDEGQRLPPPVAPGRRARWRDAHDVRRTQGQRGAGRHRDRAGLGRDHPPTARPLRRARPDPGDRHVPIVATREVDAVIRPTTPPKKQSSAR
jgi:Aldo/keto reductase family